MNKLLSLLLFLIILTPLISQSKINVVCSDLLMNEDKDILGKEYLNTLKSSLSNMQNAPTIIERDDLGDLLIFLQEEKNLQEDFGLAKIKEFKLSNVDYLLTGEFIKTPESKYYHFFLKCTKVI